MIPSGVSAVLGSPWFLFDRTAPARGRGTALEMLICLGSAAQASSAGRTDMVDEGLTPSPTRRDPSR